QGAQGDRRRKAEAAPDPRLDVSDLDFELEMVERLGSRRLHRAQLPRRSLGITPGAELRSPVRRMAPLDGVRCGVDAAPHDPLDGVELVPATPLRGTEGVLPRPQRRGIAVSAPYSWRTNGASNFGVN